MKENFDRSLAPLMLASAESGPRPAMAQVAKPLLTAAQETESQGGEP
jgi:hypothetical protein